MAAPDLKQEIDRNQARASDPRVSAWVSANAGTGKTTVLVNRVLRLLLYRERDEGPYTRPENILCLTYTKAAAAEMENRLFAILSRWAVMDGAELAGELKDLRGERAREADMVRARQLFALTLDTRGGLKIHTIHAFCERLLHRFPIEAGVQADFGVLDDQERRALRDAAIDEVLSRAARDRSAPLGDALMQVVAATGEERFRDIVDAALGEQEALRLMHRLADEFDTVGQAERHGIAAALGADAARSESGIWKEMAAALDDELIDAALKDIPRGKPTDSALLDALAKAKAAALPELRAQALCEAFLTQAGKPRKSLLTRVVREALPDLAHDLEEARARVAELASIQSALHIAACTGALLTLADGIIGAYERRKAARAALDYDDLIFRTARLLRSARAAAWVLYKLDWGIDHVLVDEAQDTSPPQWEVVSALTREFFSGEGARESARSVFAVGDEKQSIYSFQGADPAYFAQQGRAFRRAADAAGKPFDTVPLTVSFRSAEPVLKAVDGVFALDGARGGVVWDAPVVHQAMRAGQAGLVELWPPEEKLEHEPAHPMRPHEETATGAHARDRLAARIAATIGHWIDNEERLEARDRAVRPGDILILVRTRDAFVRRLIRELKARGIPVAGADRMTLTEQLAVMDLMAVADFVLMPGDDLTLATVLKSPLIGLGDDALFDLAYERPGSLWDALRDKARPNDRYAPAVKRLERWLDRADTQPPYEFFASLLEENGMEMRLALIARLGAEAGDALDEFLQRALDYERIAHPSLQGFLDWMRKAEAQVKRDMEQGRDEVRVMTVHGAKGLEANVVILPDTCTPPSGRGGGKPRLLPLPRASAPPEAPGHLVWVPAGVVPLQAIEDAKELQKEAAREEHNRLLYVAMTRARDRLYVCGWLSSKEPPEHCWYALVEAGLKPLAKEVAGALGDPVLRFEMPGKGRARDEDVDTVPAPEAWPEWAKRDAAEEKPASLPLTPSAIPGGEAEPGEQLSEQEAIPPLARAEDSRFLRGTLVHALLQYLPDLPAAEWEARARAYVEARGVQLGADRRGEIVAETLAILAREDWAALFGPGSRAEVSIAARLERGDGTTIELSGQVDRLVVRDNEVLIVDYKTNRPPPESPEEVASLYKRQLVAYRAALAGIYPGKKVRTALLWTDGPKFMELKERHLEEAAAFLHGSPAVRPGGP